MNKIKFTYDKLKSVKFGFSISYLFRIQHIIVFLKIVYFLYNHHR